MASTIERIFKFIDQDLRDQSVQAANDAAKLTGSRHREQALTKLEEAADLIKKTFILDTLEPEIIAIIEKLKNAGIATSPNFLIRLAESLRKEELSQTPPLPPVTQLRRRVPLLDTTLVSASPIPVVTTSIPQGQKTKEVVLNFLSKNPQQAMYGIEIAEKLSLTTAETWTALRSLARDGLLTSHYEGTRRYYMLASESNIQPALSLPDKLVESLPAPQAEVAKRYLVSPLGQNRLEFLQKVGKITSTGDFTEFVSSLAGVVFQEIGYSHLRYIWEKENTFVLSPEQILQFLSRLHMRQIENLDKWGLRQAIAGITAYDCLILRDVDSELLVTSAIEFKSSAGAIHKSKQTVDQFANYSYERLCDDFNHSLDYSLGRDPLIAARIIHDLRHDIPLKRITVKFDPDVCLGVPSNSAIHTDKYGYFKIGSMKARKESVPIESTHFSALIRSMAHLTNN